MTRWIAVLVMGAIVLSVTPACAVHGEEKAPDFYIGPGLAFDLEDDDTQLTISFAGSGTSEIAPDLGLYDDRLLLGVRYMFLGTRADLSARVYGGPTVFWYDDHIGGGVVIGKHLSRRVIIEASYRATSDWDGEADLSVGYGLDWPWR
ncbi:MAG: hypothetical protein ACOCX2_06340 [Armatimonadota bacterium]